MRDARYHSVTLFSALALAAGCLASKPPAPPPPVFAGQGAVVGQPKEQPLPPADDKAKPDDPCAAPSPAGDVTLLDDFEDGDNKPFKAFQREAWWFSASDNTEGSKIYPTGEFAPDKLPAPQANKTNHFAAHLSAQGQKQWGVTWGTTLRWAEKGIRCPFNGSSFTGIKFRAKGPAEVRVSFGLPETFPPDSGGTCRDQCWDAHGMSVHLTDRWDDYVVRWDKVQQGGWGAQARFDPARLLGVNFAVSAKDLPTDFWIDDIEFVSGASSKPADAPAAGSAKPAASESPKPTKPAKGR